MYEVRRIFDAKHGGQAFFSCSSRKYSCLRYVAERVVAAVFEQIVAGVNFTTLSALVLYTVRSMHSELI